VPSRQQRPRALVSFESAAEDHKLPAAAPVGPPETGLDHAARSLQQDAPSARVATGPIVEKSTSMAGGRAVATTPCVETRPARRRPRSTDTCDGLRAIARFGNRRNATAPAATTSASFDGSCLDAHGKTGAEQPLDHRRAHEPRPDECDRPRELHVEPL
jgi:hypothetical protein